MNPDNPYAAPQTIDSQPASAHLLLEDRAADSPLPLFAEWDTARLQTLLDRSNAIKDTQVVWLVMCFVYPFLGGFLFFVLIFSRSDLWASFGGYFWWISIVLTFVRFGTGFARSEHGRRLALVMDGLLGLGCLAIVAICIVGTILEPREAIITVSVIPIVSLVIFQIERSLRAMWLAPELFGPAQIRHQDLLEEFEFRKQQQLN